MCHVRKSEMWLYLIKRTRPTYPTFHCMTADMLLLIYFISVFILSNEKIKDHENVKPFTSDFVFICEKMNFSHNVPNTQYHEYCTAYSLWLMAFVMRNLSSI